MDDDATGANDGSSWCDAYVYLQNALADAVGSAGSMTEIRVAQGIYSPDQEADQTPGDRTATFGLLSDVILRDGYAGCGALEPDERDIASTEDDNLRLSADSPLINAGDPDPPLVPYLDADGHERILCGRVDMGAYEFGIGDYYCDCIIELIDFAAWDACMTGPDNGPFDSGYEAFDFDASAIGDIDLKDFAGFQLTLAARRQR